MRIQPKILLLLTALFVMLGLAELAVQQRILLPGFADLEQQAAIKDMDRVAHTLQREFDLLSVTARDWGNWADTYAFMQTRDPAYVAANLGSAAITSLRVNVLAFITPDGRYVWSVGRELQSPRPLDIDLLAGGTLPDGHPWRAVVSAGRATSGLLRTNRGAMIAVLAPILDGMEHGPHRGMVLLGRLLTDEELARIGSQAEVQVTRAPSMSLPSFSAHRADAVTERDSVTEVTRTFADVGGQPAVTLRIEVPRRISAHGRSVVHYANTFLVLAGAAVLALMLAVLDRSVLGPLSRLTRHVVRIGRTDDLSSRLALHRADEIGELAREFDEMVNRLAEARRQLANHSFNEGIAENASGVLHNLGNAMTPLGVDLAGLQDRLTDAPAADIELVLAELEHAPAGDARRADLDAYLRLTSRELAATLTGARADLDAIARTTQAMQLMLAEQSPRARSTRRYEDIALPDLVDHSAALVDPAARQRLSIEPDASLRDVGSIRVARNTLQQVFQNVILNAAEAVRDAGRQRGTLRVTAQMLGEDGARRLRVSFADDGVGIRDQDLPRIFDKGFSTKPGATNSGIGLHWCANAVVALGGEITAESPGPLGGAVIHIVMPLQPAADSAISEAA